MDKNLITCFMNFKIERLSEYGSLFYSDDDSIFVKKCLKTYFKTYINCYYYHILGTLDSSIDYSFDTLEKEFDGQRLELLDDYSVYELEVSNEEYKRNCYIINDMSCVCFDLCKLDNIKIQSRETVSDDITSYLNSNGFFKERLDSKIFKLISLVKDTYMTVCKFFKEDEFYFKLDTSIKLKDTLFFANLSPNIKLLETNYKKSLVEKIYNDEKLSSDKALVLSNKIAKDILIKKLSNLSINSYIFNINEEMFERNKFILLDYFDNPLMREYVVFSLNYNVYLNHKDYILKNMKHRYCCIQDLSHINDPVGKIATINSEEFFNYIIITDYKDKDKKDVQKIECREGCELFITKEG